MMQSPRSMTTARSLREMGVPLGTVLETEDGRALAITKEAVTSMAVAAMQRGAAREHGGVVCTPMNVHGVGGVCVLWLA
jgi:hypothetical protein